MLARPYEDPNEEWDPNWCVGRPPDFIKLPCTFTAHTALRVLSEPSLDAEPLPRVVQKGTTFSVEEIVKGPRIRGVDIIFMRPKRAYFRAHKKPDGKDCGEGGWICDTGVDKGPWHLKKLVKCWRVP